MHSGNSVLIIIAQYFFARCSDSFFIRRTRTNLFVHFERDSGSQHLLKAFRGWKKEKVAWEEVEREAEGECGGCKNVYSKCFIVIFILSQQYPRSFSSELHLVSICFVLIHSQGSLHLSSLLFLFTSSTHTHVTRVSRCIQRFHCVRCVPFDAVQLSHTKDEHSEMS